MLDVTKAEMHPTRRPRPLDEPTVKADHELLKSELGQNLTTLIDAAMARSGAFNSDDDDPLIVMSEAAGLSLAEYEAVAMQADGFGWEEIAKRQHVTGAAARNAGFRGRRKLRKFVQPSGKIKSILAC